MTDFDEVVPLRFDMSDMVPRSIATLYSYLVTRPTGQALRLGIEAQIKELGALCLTVLDFSHVVVLDYSCADETVAKLVSRFQRPDRPAEAFFLARGVDDRHFDTIDSVLARQELTIAAELVGGELVLLGQATDDERAVWKALGRRGRATDEEVAGDLDADVAETRGTLDRLSRRRVVARVDVPRRYFALRPLLDES